MISINFITELNIYHLSSLITSQDTFNIADPSRTHVIYKPSMWPVVSNINLVCGQLHVCHI